MINDEIAPLFSLDPNAPAAVGLRQGVVEAWDPETGENSIQVAGGTLVNIPSLTAESSELAAGDTVALLASGDRMLVIGKVTTPGDPGTVPTWSGDIEALAPLTDLAQVTNGLVITGATTESDVAGTGPRVVINDPAYPGQIVLYTDDPAETEPARIYPVVSGNIAYMHFVGPKTSGMGGLPATLDLEANTTTDERRIEVDADTYRLFSTHTVIDGFTQIALGDGSDYLHVVGDALQDADLSSPTNTFPGQMLTQTLSAAMTGGSVTVPTTEADITGATVTFSTAKANARYAVTASFYFSAGTGGGGVASGKLNVDGTNQAATANFTGATTLDRASVAQSWTGTLAATGSHTLKLRHVFSGTGVFSVNPTHTTITVQIFE